MRLLSTKTLQLSEYFEDTVPPYAILSHTWGEGELLLKDLEDLNVARKKPGYEKVSRSCAVAAQDGYEFIWVDTCCIDKTSSAELSEAINSMYRWYKYAEVCYAYLSDVVLGDDTTAPESSFARSRWFTRGWTLQELIAPSSVIFFNEDWKEIGTRSSLLESISTITRIHPQALLGETILDFSVAQRMSWASRRQTTRSEDIAYCLMGIFNINMPMLYGEGERAFIRLQEQIMKMTDDHTIFAWSAEGFTSGYQEALANSPAMFYKSRSIVPTKSQHNTPFTLTNRGIQIELPFKFIPAREYYLGVLSCHDLENPGQNLGILLQKIEDEGRSNVRYARAVYSTLPPVYRNEEPEFERTSIFLWQGVHQELENVIPVGGPQFFQGLIRISGLQESGISLWDAYPPTWRKQDWGAFSEIKSTMRTKVSIPGNSGLGLVGSLGFQSPDGFRFVVIFCRAKSPSVHIIAPRDGETARDAFFSLTNYYDDIERTLDRGEERDRLSRELATATVTVTTRKQMLCGERIVVLDINFARRASAWTAKVPWAEYWRLGCWKPGRDLKMVSLQKRAYSRAFLDDIQ